MDFIVYEDQKEFMKEITDVITKIMMKNKVEYNIKKFEKYDNELKKIINSQIPKIYILDIEVPNSKSGLDVAREIRKNDWNSIIIIITSHVDMGYDALKAQIMVLDFISKFNNCKNNLNQALKKALLKLDNKKVLVFNCCGITTRLYTDDILYVLKDSIDRKCIIKTIYGEINININMSEMIEKLDDRFYLSHRSCLINTEQIKTINWKENIITFNNNETIDYISRDKRKGLKEYVKNN